MKKKLFLFFLFLSAQLTFSQVPGYMGKRFIVAYSNYCFPAFIGPTARSEGMGFNLVHVVSAEYLINPIRSIGFSAQYARTGFSYKDVDYYYAGDMSVPGKINNIGFAFTYKKYSKRRIAPLGIYLKMEALFSKYIVNYNSNDFYIRSHEYYIKDIKVPAGDGSVSFHGLGAAVSMGKQRIFNHKFVLDYGIRTAIMFPLAYKFSTPVENDIYNESAFRFVFHQFLNLKIGIGFLAF